MTAQEMKWDFLFKRDNIESLKGKTFLDNEIDWFLNTAQLDLIKSKLISRTPDGTGFEETQKRIDDLGTLVVSYPAQDPITLIYHQSEHMYELPLADLKYEYLYFINAKVEVINCRNKARIRLIQHDDKLVAENDPFLSSNSTEILASFGLSSSSTGKSIYLYPDLNNTLGKIYIDYVRIPSKISQGTYTYLDGNIYPSQTSELSISVHPEIVDLAIQYASTVTGEQSSRDGAINRLQLTN
jgi:hypothetical protein